MHKWLRVVVSLALMALCGLALADLSDSSIVPKAEAGFAKDYLQKLREGSFDFAKQHMDPELAAQVTDAKLEEIAKYFPAGKVISTELIGSQTHTVNSAWQGNFSFEYQFDGGWALANVVLKRAGERLLVVGFRVTRTEKSQREINAFSIHGGSWGHYAVLASAVAIPVFIVVTLVFCVITPIPRKKWLWMLFILFGIGSVSLNWTTGAMDFQVVNFLLLGSAHVRFSEYAPWMISMGFPIGAIVFWTKRRQFMEASLAQKSALSNNPPASPLASE